MTETKPKRRWSQFRLRTLFVLLTIASVPLGWVAYQLNWIRQRRAFLADQLTRLEFAWHDEDGNPFKEKTIRWWHDVQLTDEQAPWSLRLFGEQAIDRLLIMIPEKDITFRDQTYEMRASQSDFQQAKRLFPEADIHPIRWGDEHPRDQEQRIFFDVQIVE